MNSTAATISATLLPTFDRFVTTDGYTLYRLNELWVDNMQPNGCDLAYFDGDGQPQDCDAVVLDGTKDRVSARIEFTDGTGTALGSVPVGVDLALLLPPARGLQPRHGWTQLHTDVPSLLEESLEIALYGLNEGMEPHGTIQASDTGQDVFWKLTFSPVSD